MTKPQTEFVGFTNGSGSLTWHLPPIALAALSQASPEVREQVYGAFSANIEVFCTALLRSFGSGAKAQTMNLIMHDLKEIVDKP
jgi:hypothetical protein